MNTTFDYHLGLRDLNMRVRLGVKNLTDERAPLADRYFGFFGDAHSDYGRYYYVIAADDRGLRSNGAPAIVVSGCWREVVRSE